MKTPNGSRTVKQLKIGFVLAKSFTLSAFAMFIDTLRLASDDVDKSSRRLADWHVIGSTRHLISSSCGVQVAPTSGLVDPREFSFIVVVGGLLSSKVPVDDETIAYLKGAAEKKVPLIGVCTGTFILAEAGLMRTHQTCVSWLHYSTFRDRFPHHPVRADRIFNLDRSRGSCAGGSSAADLAALIVREHISRRAERNALEILQIERARSALEIQTRRPLRIECADPRLKAALIMMEANSETIVPIDHVASCIGLSRRHMERLFLKDAGATPAAIYRRIRLEKARHLLTRTKAPLIDIAMEAGFENASHFAKAFRQVFGQPPSRFRAAEAASNIQNEGIAGAAIWM